jgi:GNAT superfamily N-acetyltransferase
MRNRAYCRLVDGDRDSDHHCRQYNNVHYPEERASQTIPMTIRIAAAADLEFLCRNDDLPPEIIARKIDLEEMFVAEQSGIPIGHLRLEYLWSKIPYIGLIRLLEPWRRRGTGKALVLFVAERLRGGGYDYLYSSSQADEPEPQNWHRHIGFEECGVITGINPGGVGEIFFRMRL